MPITPTNRIGSYIFTLRKFSKPPIRSSVGIGSIVLLVHHAKPEPVQQVTSTRNRRSYQREQFAYFVPNGLDPFGLQEGWVDTGVRDASGRPIYKVNSICVVKGVVNGVHTTSIIVPCPDRPVDPKVDVKTYDCYGLAFRTYEYSKDLAEVNKKLAGCGQCTDGKCQPGELRCLLWVFDARIDYPVGPKATHPFGGSEPQIANNSFHIVCATEGELACSKNAGGPVSPPGPCKSFAPKPSDIAGVPKGGVVTISNVKESCHCCPQ